MAVTVGAAVLAGGLALGGTALAAPATPAASGDTTSSAVATPDGSFHIPVVPYAFSGSLSTTFDLYALPTIPSGTIAYEVVLTKPGDEQDYNPPVGSTIILRSDTDGLLLKRVAAGTTTLSPDPIPGVDFSASGLNGFITAAGDYSLEIKFFGPTGLTGAWWTSIYFDGAATATNAPNWQWDPTQSDGTDTTAVTTAGTAVRVTPTSTTVG
jgi:hypothetical protein